MGGEPQGWAEISRMVKKNNVPSKETIDEAKENPGRWEYQIEENYEVNYRSTAGGPLSGPGMWASVAISSSNFTKPESSGSFRERN